jgi:hypothetical protein
MTRWENDQERGLPSVVLLISTLGNCRLWSEKRVRESDGETDQKGWRMERPRHLGDFRVRGLSDALIPLAQHRSCSLAYSVLLRAYRTGKAGSPGPPKRTGASRFGQSFLTNFFDARSRLVDNRAPGLTGARRSGLLRRRDRTEPGGGR